MDTVKGSVNLKWIDETLMLGIDSRGRTISIGQAEDREPKWGGMKASDLLLLSAAACSAHDVITILKKQKQMMNSFDIICTGEQMTDPPHSFIALEMKFVVKGKVDPEKLKRAIQLSQEKYCSVISTLRPTVEISFTSEVQPESDEN
jgi:putative redox protein